MTDIRTAVVSGAGSGIGAATVAALAARRYRVACLDIDKDAVERTAKAAGPGHLALGVDVADEKQVKKAFRAIARAFRSINALSTCAGILHTKPFLEISPGDFQRLYAVNLVGTYLCIRETAALMPPGGRICTVGSIAGIRGGGFLGTVAYAASKGAVGALTKVAARELAGRGITVNMVSPGGTETPMTKGFVGAAATSRPPDATPLMKRMAQPAEIAEAIAWLLSPQSSYVSGANLVADGGILLL